MRLALEGGDWNQVLQLKAEGGLFVLRLATRTGSESIAYQHVLINYVAAQIPEVPAPLTGHNGETFFDVRGNLPIVHSRQVKILKESSFPSHGA